MYVIKVMRSSILNELFFKVINEGTHSQGGVWLAEIDQGFEP